MAMLEVRVDGLALDMTTNSPVVILAAKAWAIAMELSGVGAKRPMTHDLLKTVIAMLSAHVEKIEITELKEQTFYARVLIKENGKLHEIDARPSDSIALALKTSAPIFAEEGLFNLQMPGQSTEEGQAPESLADRLKKINPEDFGKYSL